MAIRKIGVMTGGGDCPGLNAVIRAAVTVGAERHGWEVLGIEDAFHGLVNLDYRSPHGNMELTTDFVQELLGRGGTVIGTSNRADPFRFPVERGGKIVEEDVSDRVLENFRKLSLDALISIGGDGSMGIAKQMADKGLPVVGVPKSIDNDLAATDQTFGFNTAVQFATDALDRIRDTAVSHDRVMVVEVMGRDAGFIALEAGIAGGAHAILIPEIEYRLEPIVEMVKMRCLNARPFSVVVVAEGAKPVGGEPSMQEAKPGAMPRLQGAGERFGERLQQALKKVDVRVTVLGHVQRGGTPSCFDRVLATRFGHHASELVAAEKMGRMVALRGTQIIDVPLEEATSQPKRVRADSQRIATARALGVVFGDEP